MTTIGSHDGAVRPSRSSLRRRRATAMLRGEGTLARRAWRRAYVRSITVGDALSALVAALAGYVIRRGPDLDGAVDHPSAALIAVFPVVWVGAMLVARCYEERFLWIGPVEFQRVFFAAALLLAGLATVSWGFGMDLPRGQVVVALPLAAALTVLQRYAHRRRVHRRRACGHFQQTAIIVGHRSGVAALRSQIDREAYHGYRVVGCCLPDDPADPGATSFEGLPILGGVGDVTEVVHRYEVDTVAVLPCPELEAPALRRLGWELEKTRAELLLAPAVTEIAGPRVRIRPVCGLPLLHMERPELQGVRRLTKEVVDRTVAAVVVLLLLPVLLGIALAVKATSRGPAFFRQNRVGRDGELFPMLKFRSMVSDAELRLPQLIGGDEGNGVLFKMRADPRITTIGRVLRRYSLDELPQLLNVLRGEMSLVGPRPPLPSETERYGFDMHRRFLVKPGITGLWQVSGRSDLSWDDSVRIDVRYVENWSLTFDLMIVWKTLGAIVRGPGAY